MTRKQCKCTGRGCSLVQDGSDLKRSATCVSLKLTHRIGEQTAQDPRTGVEPESRAERLFLPSPIDGTHHEERRQNAGFEDTLPCQRNSN